MAHVQSCLFRPLQFIASVVVAPHPGGVRHRRSGTHGEEPDRGAPVHRDDSHHGALHEPWDVECAVQRRRGGPGGIRSGKRTEGGDGTVSETRRWRTARPMKCGSGVETQARAGNVPLHEGFNGRHVRKPRRSHHDRRRRHGGQAKTAGSHVPAARAPRSTSNWAQFGTLEQQHQHYQKVNCCFPGCVKNETLDPECVTPLLPGGAEAGPLKVQQAAWRRA